MSSRFRTISLPAAPSPPERLTLTVSREILTAGSRNNHVKGAGKWTLSLPLVEYGDGPGCLVLIAHQGEVWKRVR